MKRVLLVLTSLLLVTAGCNKKTSFKDKDNSSENVILDVSTSDLSNFKQTYTEIDPDNPLRTNFKENDLIGFSVIAKAKIIAGSPTSADVEQKDFAFKRKNGKWEQVFDAAHPSTIEFATNGTGGEVESRFMGYYPHSTTAGSPFAATAFDNFPTAEFNLSSEQSTTESFYLNDALAASTDIVPNTVDETPDRLSMTMQHLTSFMQFRITKSDEWGDDDQLTLSYAALSGVYLAGSYDMSKLSADDIKASVKHRDGIDTSRVFKNYDPGVVLQKKTAEYLGEEANMLIVPMTVNEVKPSRIELKVTHRDADGVEETNLYVCQLPVYNDPEKDMLRPNYKYVYNVSVKRGAIDIILDGPEEWGEGPTTSGEVILVGPDSKTVELTAPSTITDNNGYISYDPSSQVYQFSIKSTLYPLSRLSIEVQPTGQVTNISDITQSQEMVDGVMKTVETGTFVLTGIPSNDNTEFSVPVNTYRTFTIKVIQNLTSDGGAANKRVIQRMEVKQEPQLAVISVTPEGNLAAKSPANVVVRLQMAGGLSQSNFMIVPVSGASASLSTESGNVLVAKITGIPNNVGASATTKQYTLKIVDSGMEDIVRYQRSFLQLAAKN